MRVLLFINNIIQEAIFIFYFIHISGAYTITQIASYILLEYLDLNKDKL